ncbi:polysaccharide biosynthesis tyrosine autokinase [Flavihumibacter sp. R14]|nr:polysaccharide biosynthesis tyrosine autokinase [Flavihumibacter soli]
MTYNNSSLQSQPVKGDIMQVIFNYLRYWYIFIASVVIFLGLAWLYLQTKTPAYNVKSTLIIQEDKKGEGAMQATAFSDLDMFKQVVTVDNEIAALRSRSLWEKVLSQLPINVSYYVDGTFKTEELYGEDLPVVVVVEKLTQGVYSQTLTLEILDEGSYKLSSETHAGTYKFGQKVRTGDFAIKVLKGPSFSKRSGPIFVNFNNVKKLAERYSGTLLGAAPISQESNTIVLTLVDVIPERSIDILNKLIETYNRENIDHKNQLALNTIKFIDNRLMYLGSDLSTTGKEVEDFKQANRVTNVSSDAEQSLANAGEYNRQLSEVDIQRNVVASMERYINRPPGQYELVPSTLGLEDPTLAGLTKRYNELQLDRQRLLRTAEPGNPLVVNINEQLASLKENISENLRNVKRGLDITRNNLQANSSKFESQIRTAPTIERGLAERGREQGVKEGLYQYLLQKREETTLSLSATTPTSRVVDAPNFDSNPVSPKISFIYLCAFLLGLSLPAGGIFIKDLFNTKVQDVSEIEKISGAMILGELSHKENKDALVINKSSRTTISELFRYIRTNLNYMTEESGNKVMLITSSMKGEGKTFFSINLGATLSLVDKKVVLLEFDVRKPDLLRNLNIQASKGLVDFLNDESSLDEIILQSPTQANLFVIGCGDIPDNPAELLMSPRIPELFEQLKERFDYIIIDTSPVGQVADAFSLAPYADASIYLVRYNYTNKVQLNILKDIFENNKLNNPMIVLNDAKAEGFKGYGYGGYGYGFAEQKAYT